MDKKILVISPTSLVGSRFVELLSKGWQITGAGIKDDLTTLLPLTSFQDLNVIDSKSIDGVLETFEGKYLINFAGATDVSGIEKARPQNPNDQSELDKNLAYKINVLGTRNIIESAKKHGKTPIFISTDFVFDGTHGPYAEDAQIATSPDLVSWYAWTKILAEHEVVNSGIKALTIRISYPYRRDFSLKGDVARSFLELYDKSLKGEAKLYPLFIDQFFTPTFIDDLSGAIDLLLEKGVDEGVYHLASPEVTNFYKFFCELLRIARNVTDPESLLMKGSFDKYYSENPHSAKWPKNGGLRSDKIVRLGFTPTSWREGIKKIYG